MKNAFFFCSLISLIIVTAASADDLRESRTGLAMAGVASLEGQAFDNVYGNEGAICDYLVAYSLGNETSSQAVRVAGIFLDRNPWKKAAFHQAFLRELHSADIARPEAVLDYLANKTKHGGTLGAFAVHMNRMNVIGPGSYAIAPATLAYLCK